MAGIIAQLTRAARVRRDRRTYGTNKCLYTLQPFDSNGFKVDITISINPFIPRFGQICLTGSEVMKKIILKVKTSLTLSEIL